MYCNRWAGWFWVPVCFLGKRTEPSSLQHLLQYHMRYQNGKAWNYQVHREIDKNRLHEPIPTRRRLLMAFNYQPGNPSWFVFLLTTWAQEIIEQNSNKNHKDQSREQLIIFYRNILQENLDDSEGLSNRNGMKLPHKGMWVLTQWKAFVSLWSGISAAQKSDRRTWVHQPPTRYHQARVWHKH